MNFSNQGKQICIQENQSLSRIMIKPQALKKEKEILVISVLWGKWKWQE